MIKDKIARIAGKVVTSMLMMQNFWDFLDEIQGYDDAIVFIYNPTTGEFRKDLAMNTEHSMMAEDMGLDMDKAVRGYWVESEGILAFHRMVKFGGMKEPAGEHVNTVKRKLKADPGETYLI